MLDIVSRHFACTDHRYDNFIVGLTNISPAVSTPTLWQYEVCGQYSGTVPHATTVSLYCQACIAPFQFVIVQLPSYDHLVACEVEVLVKGTRMSNTSINILIFIIQAVQRCYFSYTCRRTPSDLLHDLLDYCLTWYYKINMVMLNRL